MIKHGMKLLDLYKSKGLVLLISNGCLAEDKSTGEYTSEDTV